ncbi:hypothetical protein MLD52_19795 [Puniceicoccaceae bacterium K14]|nr:hypothetical protein [Puniceicoccaceae bacterium K14]
MKKPVVLVALFFMTALALGSDVIKERVLMVGLWLEDGTIERGSKEARFLVALSEIVVGHRYLDKMGYYSSPILLPQLEARNPSILNYEPKVNTFQDSLEFYTTSLKLNRSKLVYEKEVGEGFVVLVFSSADLIEGNDLHLYLANENFQVLDYRLEHVSRNTTTELGFDEEAGVLTISFGPIVVVAGVDQRLKFRKSQILINSDHLKFEHIDSTAPAD